MIPISVMQTRRFFLLILPEKVSFTYQNHVMAYGRTGHKVFLLLIQAQSWNFSLLQGRKEQETDTISLFHPLIKASTQITDRCSEHKVYQL